LTAFQTLDEQQKINAVRLLAQKNFDALGLSSQLHDIATEVLYTYIFYAILFCLYKKQKLY